MTVLPPSGSILTVSVMETVAKTFRKLGKKLVWTNGCFDILHAGHVLLLEQAKDFGDVLVVGMNSDTSVRKLKGKDRPFNNQNIRAKVLSALRAVDYVVIFKGLTPIPVLARLKPDIYVKGGDYTVDTVNQDERRLVESYGGIVKTVGLSRGLSTTALAKRIGL